MQRLHCTRDIFESAVFLQGLPWIKLCMTGSDDSAHGLLQNIIEKVSDGATCTANLKFESGCRSACWWCAALHGSSWYASAS